MSLEGKGSVAFSAAVTRLKKRMEIMFTERNKGLVASILGQVEM